MSINPDRYVEVSANGTPNDPQAAADLAAATQAGAIAGDIAGAAAGAAAGAQAGTEVAAAAGAAAGATAGEIAGAAAGTASGSTAGAVAGAAAGGPAGAAAATALLAARSVTGGGLATGGGTLDANRVITVTAASQAEAEAGTATTVAMTPQRWLNAFNFRTTTFTRSLLATANQSAFLTALGAIPSTALTFLSSLAGATSRLVSSKLADTVSVFDFAGATDADRLLAAVAAGVTDLYVPAPGITITSAVTLPIGAAGFRFGGPGVVRVTGGGAIRFGNGVTALPDLVSDIVPWDNTAEFAAPHGLTVGRVFGVHNQTDYSFSKYRPVYQDGQMFRVIEVLSPTEVRFSGNARRTFTVAAVDCFVLNAGPVDLSSLTVDPTGSTADLILTVDGSVGARFDGMRILAGGDYTALELYRCYDATFNGPRSEAYISDAYPIAIANCQKVVMYAGTGLYSRRHCIAFGGRGGLGSVPCADVLIIGGITESNPNTFVGSIDAHGNSEFITYSQCIVYQSANVGGRNITLDNCVIYARNSADGNAVFAREVVGGLYRFNQCRFITAGDGASFALLYFVMGAVGADPGGLSEDLRLQFNGCELSYEGSSLPSVRLMDLFLGPNPWVGGFRVDVEVNDFRWPIGGAAPFAAVVFSGAANVSAVASVAFKGAANFPAGTLLYLPLDPANNTVPVRHDLTLKGATGARPGFPNQGQQYFDTTLDPDGKPIWYTGTAWVDATGAVV